MISLYVGNLNYDLDEIGLRDAFSAQGWEVERARVITDRDTGRSKGFGFVDVTDTDAKEILSSMDGFLVAGRPLRVALAETKKAPRERGSPAPRERTSHWKDERSRRRPRRGDSF